jgi:hypothetical protein
MDQLKRAQKTRESILAKGESQIEEARWSDEEDAVVPDDLKVIQSSIPGEEKVVLEKTASSAEMESSFVNIDPPGTVDKDSDKDNINPPGTVDKDSDKDNINPPGTVDKDSDKDSEWSGWD